MMVYKDTCSVIAYKTDSLKVGLKFSPVKIGIIDQFLEVAM